MQETNFDFEIVIGEDCSKDNTRAICQRLANENPGKIRLLLREKNLGMHENHRQTHHACRGQYIAMLEGDDFWTRPDKLQKQVDFLDANPECVLCFHNVLMFDQHSDHDAVYNRPEQPQFITTRDIIQEIYVNTASVVMRNGLFTEFLDLGKDLVFGDWVYYVWLSTFGLLGYIPEVMACYRLHDSGTWMSASPGQRVYAFQKTLDHIDTFFQGKYHDMIEILKPRARMLMEVDCTSKMWRRRAIKAETRVEELERSRRVLKLRQRAVERELADLKAKMLPV
jgi:glycosyltransferase involved in cell wall biosynthesis